MHAVTYTTARATLANMMDRVCNNHAPLIITRQKAEPVVMMSLADYEAIEETSYLLKSRANALRLEKSLAQATTGRAKERKIGR